MREVAALTNLRAVCGWIGHIERAFANGNEAGAREALSQLAAEVVPALPRIAADLETAKAFDRTQSTLAAIFAGRAQPHPHASNDHLAAPSEPAPSIA
jgi:hypothetical protein